MQHLAKLIQRKVQRERELGEPMSPLINSIGAGQKASKKRCWLCDCEVRLRFRLKDTTSLCFDCFRTSYLAIILPSINNTDARQRSNRSFLGLISELEAEEPLSTGSASSGMSPMNQRPFLENSTLCSVTDPCQASFVMSASVMRHQRVRQQGAGGASPTTIATSKVPSCAGAAANAHDDISFWHCPACTFINTSDVKACAACHFNNPGKIVCPLCKKIIPVAPPKPGTEMSKCTNGKPHILWRCVDCGEMNALDGDKCMSCHKDRFWACSQCTALHRSGREGDGLRYCPTCGSYNTPEDVVAGQAMIDQEEKKAHLMAAQQQQQQQQHSSGGEDEKVFGVNDSLTMAELERQQTIAKNDARLQRRLDRLQVPRHTQKPDGNCLFAALAHQLFGNGRLHSLVRCLIICYMKANAEDYKVLFDGEEEWIAYLAQMREAGSWGDELCLNAAARCFSVNIHVITSAEVRWHMVFQHDQLGESCANLRGPPLGSPAGGLASTGHVSSGAFCLFLAYKAPVHYDDITPSPVNPVVLSDLLVPILKRMIEEQRTAKR